jgi:hypothetical protein
MARPPPQCRGPCAECHEGVWGAAVLREGARILSPGGVLALTDNNPQSAVIQVRALERGQRECFSQPPTTHRALSSRYVPWRGASESVSLNLQQPTERCHPGTCPGEGPARVFLST